jgi:hypothetical protein
MSKQRRKYTRDFNIEIVESTLKETREDAILARKRFSDLNIDFLIYFHATNAIGDIIFELLKINCPIGLWAVRESSNSGPMPFRLICWAQSL